MQTVDRYLTQIAQKLTDLLGINPMILANRLLNGVFILLGVSCVRIAVDGEFVFFISALTVAILPIYATSRVSRSTPCELSMRITSVLHFVIYLLCAVLEPNFYLVDNFATIAGWTCLAAYLSNCSEPPKRDKTKVKKNWFRRLIPPTPMPQP